MRRLNKLWLVATVASALLVLPALASARGLVTRSSEIPVASRVKLQKAIAAYRVSNPEAFAAVRNVKGHRPEVYRKRRNPVPSVSLELRRLGRAALLPMLEALAFKAPERGKLTDREWRALKLGMLQSVGLLRDKKSSAVLQRAFKNASHPRVQTAAAVALGRLGDDAAYATLAKSARASGARQLAAIRGLGQCRRLESAELLAELLGNASDTAKLVALGESLGFVSSSWAWRAMGSAAQNKGLAVRRVAAEALVPAFIEHTGLARTAIKVGLTMGEYPQLRAVVAAHRQQADEATAKALDRLVARIEKRLRRR